MKILVALDGSVHCHAALEAVLKRSWPEGSTVKLVTVRQPNETAFNVLYSERKAQTPEDQRNELGLSQRFLLDLKADLSWQLPGVEIVHELLIGRAQEVLVKLAHEWSADLIIMGCQDKKGLDLMLLGSVSQSVLNLAPCPVHIARWGTEEFGGSGNVTNILVPMDHSHHSSAALEWLLEQNFAGPHKFTLITVVKSINSQFANQHSTERASDLLCAWQTGKDASLCRLKEWGAKLEDKFGKGTASCHVIDGEPATAILSLAANLNAQLIVMGSHGRGRLSRLFIGSVSQAVSIHAPCSVEIVRGRQSRLHGAISLRASRQHGSHRDSRFITCATSTAQVRQSRPPITHAGL